MPQYTLGYGMRLDKGTAPERAHTHVSITLPDGSEGNMALHVMSGTADEIKARPLDSVDAFFEMYTELFATPSLTEARNRQKVF